MAVCDSGSMTDAARKLKLTQPAVSRIIRQLDEAVGIPVMDRDLRPIRLTNAGEALRKRGERVLREADELIPAVREAVHGKLMLLRIGLTESVASLLVPLLTGEIARLATTLSVWEGHSDQHKDALKSRDLDLAVTSNTHEKRQPSAHQAGQRAMHPHCPVDAGGQAAARPGEAHRHAALPALFRTHVYGRPHRSAFAPSRREARAAARVRQHATGGIHGSGRKRLGHHHADVPARCEVRRQEGQADCPCRLPRSCARP